MRCFLRGAAIPLRCSRPGPCIPYLIAKDRGRGVGPYGSWAQLWVPCRHRCGRRGRHLWVAGGHGELATQVAYTVWGVVLVLGHTLPEVYLQRSGDVVP